MPTLDIFQQSAEALPFEAGDVIFSQGDPAGPMLVVIEGHVEIRVDGLLVDTIGPGGVVGEMALIDSDPRSASVLAITGGKYVEVGEKRFLFLVQNTPYFAIEMLQILAKRLRHMDKLIGTVGPKSSGAA